MVGSICVTGEDKAIVKSHTGVNVPRQAAPHLASSTDTL
jgi:hypothetical protein